MIDVHCHLNFKAFEKDYDEVIKRAFEAGVTTIINVGTKIDSSEKALELAKTYENLYAIVGIHPHHADKPLHRHSERSEESQNKLDSSVAKLPQNDNGNDWLEQLGQIAKHPKVVAIGEIGMDYYRYQSNDIVDPKLQRDTFVKQIELAAKLRLPLQIHNRHAGKDIIDTLLYYDDVLENPPGMFHCFSGNLEFLKKVLSMGFYVGFDGNISYEGVAPGEDTDLKDLVRYTPLDRIVTETDTPFLTPEPHRGRRNEPLYVILVGEFIAKLKGLSFEEVVEKTTQNTKRIFQLDARR